MACRRVARLGVDVEDVVNEAVCLAFQRVEDVLQGSDTAIYLHFREILKDVLARMSSDPHTPKTTANPPERSSTQEPLAFEDDLGHGTWRRYEEAVERLPVKWKKVVVLFVECGLDFGEMQGALGLKSAKEARMEVARAIKRLAELMDADV